MMSGNMSTIASAQEVSNVEKTIITAECVNNVEDTKTATVKEIATEQDLKNIANDIYGNYRLKNDIKLSGKEWTSIPEFYGTLDGNGHTISNLKSTKGQGLFTILYDSAVVKNLTISGNITTTKNDAALLAIGSEGSIINCISTGSVKQLNDKNGAYNLAGMVLENSGYMENCVNRANVEQVFKKADTEFDLAYCTYVGGLVCNQMGTLLGCENHGNVVVNGASGGGLSALNNDNAMTIDGLNTGNVTATLDMQSATFSAGGVTGVNSGLLQGCVNQGNITTTVKHNSFKIGGVVAISNNYSEIIKCKNEGTVSGYIGDVGGVVGATAIVLIADCVNEGEIIGTGVLNRRTTVGGVVANITSRNGHTIVRDCVNRGNVSCKGRETGGGEAGGIIGCAYVLGDVTTELFNLVNNGEVNSEGGFAGGIVANAQADKLFDISQCKNTANIYGKDAAGIGFLSFEGIQMSSCYNTGNIYGEDGAFGIAASAEGKVSDCYNLGNVTGIFAYGAVGWVYESGVLSNVYVYGKATGKAEAYGIAFNAGGAIKNCYYLNQSEYVNEQTGTGISATEAQQQQIYIGFDFNSVWEMKNQNGVNLPSLREKHKTVDAKLIKNEITVKSGLTEEIVLTKEKNVSCYSGDASVLKIQALYDENYNRKEGVKLEANKAGNTEIYVVFEDGQILKCKVNVVESISKGEVTLSTSSYNYNGKAKTPSVTVMLGNKKLVKNTDYTVSYKNNKNIGKATVTIKGKGNYTGTLTKTFTINAKKGATFTSGSYKYKVTSSSAVAFTGFAKKETSKVTIPKTVKYGGKTFKVTAVASKALKGKTKVTQVTIGANVKTIGVSAFEGCKKLSKVTIGSAVTTIDDKAFRKCTALKSITIPSKVTKIDKQAFYGCKNLKTITIKATKLKTVGKESLKGIYAKATIKVPKSKLTAYKKLLKKGGLGSKVKVVKY